MEDVGLVTRLADGRHKKVRCVLHPLELGLLQNMRILNEYDTCRNAARSKGCSCASNSTSSTNRAGGSFRCLRGTRGDPRCAIDASGCNKKTRVNNDLSDRLLTYRACIEYFDFNTGMLAQTTQTQQP